MDWTSCKKNSLAKEIRRDDKLIVSLLASSDKKVKTEAIIPSDNTTASSKLTLLYDAIREILEAVAIAHGFKIYNHECYSAFLKEIVRKSSLADKFDKMRKLRNSINYYGRDITAEEARPILKEMRTMIRESKGLLTNSKIKSWKEATKPFREAARKSGFTKDDLD